MKKSEFKKQIREEIIEILSEEEGSITDKQVQKNKDYQNDLKTTKGIVDDIEKSVKKVNDQLDDLSEDEEPTSADLKKKDSVTTVGRKLQEITKEMKSTLAKWKKSEGSEKEKHLKRLKELTKMKKELESML
jgi:hypothetical protein